MEGFTTVANEQNLIPGAHRLTVEEASKGGKKSGETRRRRKAFAEAFNVLLGQEFTDTHGNSKSGVELIAMKTFRAAMDGDLKAMQIIRDTVGEMPVQRVEVDTIDPQARAEMDELLGLNE